MYNYLMFLVPIAFASISYLSILYGLYAGADAGKKQTSIQEKHTLRLDYGYQRLVHKGCAFSLISLPFIPVT